MTGARTIPSPTGGWNARDALEAMPETDAVDLVNWIPTNGVVTGRGGSKTLLSALGAAVDTLIPYEGTTGTKLLAAYGTTIANITGFGVPTVLSSAFIASRWQFASFDDKLALVNGFDTPQIYNGTALSAMVVTPLATPVNAAFSSAATGGTLSPGTYYYRVSAMNEVGETLASTETSIVIPAALSTPVNSAFATSTTGGTLPAGTYYYRVSAINSLGRTLASTETSQVTTGSTSTVTVNWGAVTGATGYAVYGRTTGAEQFIALTTATAYTDTGSIAPNGALPTSNTTSTTTNSITVKWSKIDNATGYKVYGRATGAELLIASVGTVISYVDTGSITPAGALPGANTTAPNATLFIGVVNFKGRAFYWEKNSQNVWYCNAGAFQGAFHRLSFANFTQRGGYIVQVITWTRDSGDGVDDYCAFIFSTGETLIYQGDDPSDSLRWSMVGRYQIGAPLGTRSHIRYASTEILLTDDGFVGLDEAIQNARTEIVNTFGGKIVRAAKEAAKKYRTFFGWQAIYYPAGNLFIANIPIASDQFQQYVKNTNTGAWTRFTGWPARCFAIYADRLYFGTKDGRVVLADTRPSDGYRQTFSDDGSAIEYGALPAYQKFGSPGLKTQLTAARVVTNVFDPRALSLNAFSDYRVKPLPPIQDPQEFAQGQWNVSPWNTDAWASENNDPASMYAHPSFRPVQAFGFAIALSVRYRSSVQNVSWFSTTFVYKQAGVN